MQKKLPRIIWILNLLIFTLCVYLGIEQAGKGAIVSIQEDKIGALTEERQKLSDSVFVMGRDDELSEKANDLGFVKPSKLVYFNQIDEALTANLNGF